MTNRTNPAASVFRLLTLLIVFTLPALVYGHKSRQQTPLPPGERLFWGKEPIEVTSRTRAEIVLNGLWKFLPQPGAERPEENADWGYVRVPGDWTKDASDNRQGVLARGDSWKDLRLDQLSRAWYQRSITIPENWRGRAIELDFAGISTDAVVYVDNIECGRVFWPAGTVDISRVAQPGQTHTLLVKVVATADEGEVLRILDSEDRQASRSNKSLDSRGIFGDVILQSRPSRARVTDVFLRPSVRQKRLDVTAEVTGYTSTAPIRLIARFYDAKGKLEKEFTASAPVTPGAAVQTINLRYPWPNPRLWDIGTPNLYTMRLEVAGTDGLFDEYPQEFGFREFWISGRKFFLNGTEIRFRPFTAPQTQTPTEGTTELIDGAIDGMAWAGFNLAELWPNDVDERGACYYHERWADRADHKGFALTGVLPSLHRYLFDGGSHYQWSPQNQERWLNRVMPILRRLRNHPSLLMWSPSANFFGNEQDQDPRFIGKRNLTRTEWGQKMVTAGNEAITALRPLDPTRPIFMHQGGDVGDVFTTNTFLDMIPLQERTEWLSHWRGNGAMPFMAVEFGTPLLATFMRGRNGFDEAVLSEPLMTEFAAIYLGPDAYRQEPAPYRQRIAVTHDGDQKWKTWHGASELETAYAFQAVESLFITQTWRTWRTAGITGGMVPWSGGHGWYPTDESRKRVSLPAFAPGRRGTYVPTVPKSALNYLRPQGGDVQQRAAQALLANNAPTLAWICGPPEFYADQTHHFFPAGTVHKQVALLNDTRTVQTYDYDWTVRVGNRVVGRGAGRGALTVSETRFLPLNFTTPRVTSRTDGEIQLIASIGGRKHTDRFPFRVYPPQPQAKGKVAVYGTPGVTTEMLKKLGYTTEAFGPKMTTPLIVVERETLSKGNAAGLSYLEVFVRNGGRLLIMAQSPDWLRKSLGLRVAPHLTRRVFPVVDSAHPVLSGLDATDLRDWTGASTLVPPYPTYDYASDNYLKAPSSEMPYYGWHWGNRHAVSSASIEKPHRTGWRPLLECEFDLAYSPLMELDYGKGRVLLCTLDLEDHALRDPAAKRLAVQLLQYAATAPLAPRLEQTVLIGDNDDADLLRTVGVTFEKTNSLPSTPSVIVVGARTRFPADGEPLAAVLAKGHRVLFLAREIGDETDGVRMERQIFGGARSVPDWPECRGLSLSDLRWRTDTAATLLTGSPKIGADGLLGRVSGPNGGVALYCQISPEILPKDKAYFRYTRWRQTRALAQVLANLGATFTLDARAFHPLPSQDNRSANSLYHPDYRSDFPLGDDPYRYYRW